MQIKCPFVWRFDEDNVNKILPAGFVAETWNESKLSVRKETNREPVGFVEQAENGVLVTFFNHTDSGMEFTTAFGLRHPSFNPLQVQYGFVYETPDHLFQLDKRPCRLESEAVAQLENYDTAGNVHLVSFLLGDWEEKFLTVKSMRKVLFSGGLGVEIGPRMLLLGNIENERTV